MTIHLISVGLSVLRALENPDKILQANERLLEKVEDSVPHKLLEDAGITDDLDADRIRASEWIAEALSGADTSPKAKQLADLATAITPPSWPARMSAELDTFARVPGNRGTTVGRKNLAVLICSDTADGLLAGVWNAIALADEDDAKAALAKVTYVPEPQAVTEADLRRGRVVLVRVTGMDAGDKGFGHAMGGLGLLAKELIAHGDLRKEEEFQFILSGGFKAAVPYLIGLAEAVRSVDDECVRELGRQDLIPVHVPYPVKAWVQHETARDDAPPIQLPLRRLVAASFRPELTGYNDNGIREERLGTRLLEGYAFEVRHKWNGTEFYELTPFGEGLRALFSPARDRVGD